MSRTVDRWTLVDARVGKAITSSSAMRAPRPTARPALSLEQLGPHARDVVAPRLGLLDRDDPADPLVARQRREAVPRRAQTPIRAQRPAQVLGDVVYHAGRDLRRPDLRRPRCRRVPHHDKIGRRAAIVARAGAVGVDRRVVQRPGSCVDGFVDRGPRLNRRASGVEPSAKRCRRARGRGPRHPNQPVTSR